MFIERGTGSKQYIVVRSDAVAPYHDEIKDASHEL